MSFSVRRKHEGSEKSATKSVSPPVLRSRYDGEEGGCAGCLRKTTANATGGLPGTGAGKFVGGQAKIG